MGNKSKRKQSNVKQPGALEVRQPKPRRVCLACRERGKKMLDELIAKEWPVKDTKVNGKDDEIKRAKRHY